MENASARGIWHVNGQTSLRAAFPTQKTYLMPKYEFLSHATPSSSFSFRSSEVFAASNMTTRSTMSRVYSYDVNYSRSSSSTGSTDTTLQETEWKAQVLPTPYISRRRLLEKLSSRYGRNGFRVEVYLFRSMT